MELLIKNSTIYFNGNSYCLDDLHTSDFYKFSDNNAYKYYNDTFFVNELYIYFIQNSLALEYFIKKNNITLIDIKDASEILCFYIIDIAKKNNIHIIDRKNIFFHKVYNSFKFNTQLISSALFLIYLMLKIPFKKFKKNSEEIAIIRQESTKNKILKIDINAVYEDPYCKESIYSFFNVYKRVKWVINSLLNSYFQFKELKVIMTIYLGENSKYLIQSFYGKRLVHSNLFKFVLNNFFKNNHYKTFYTGNNLDRFAVIEERLAEKHKIKLICIPHGLEYGFKFPKGFTGDLFYSTSKLASSYFNALYSTSKFIYDESIISKIFKHENKNSKGVKVVYFSEPRESRVNHQIISDIIPLLNSSNIELSLKLHPKEKKEDFLKYNIEIIEGLSEAINGNICFARKSTTLVESVYNNSAASAILLNNKDKTLFKSFPSLQNKEINQAYSIEELFNWIFKQYKLKT